MYLLETIFGSGFDVLAIIYGSRMIHVGLTQNTL